MYLLIHGVGANFVRFVTFTFHNVSINSKFPWRIVLDNGRHLHSIMYLLILSINDTNPGKLLFTFHNVSINSVLFRATYSSSFYLHSIMYLLIHRSPAPTESPLPNLHSIMYLLIHLLH